MTTQEKRNNIIAWCIVVLTIACFNFILAVCLYAMSFSFLWLIGFEIDSMEQEESEPTPIRRGAWYTKNGKEVFGKNGQEPEWGEYDTAHMDVRPDPSRHDFSIPSKLTDNSDMD